MKGILDFLMSNEEKLDFSKSLTGEEFEESLKKMIERTPESWHYEWIDGRLCIVIDRE